MKITNEFLLEYIATMPELSGWHLRKINRNDYWPEWRRFQIQLCHTSFAGESLPIFSVDNGNESDLAKHVKNRVEGEKNLPHYEDESLMLYGIEQ